MGEKKHLMEKVHGVLVMTLLKMLQFLVLIIVHPYTNNQKNNFSVLGEGPNEGINNSTGAAEKKISINVSKANTKCCLNLHYI